MRRLTRGAQRRAQELQDLIVADADALANAIAQAVQAAVQPIVNNMPAPPAAAAPGPFAKSPALARADVLDCTKKGDALVFADATKPLDTQFSLESPNIPVFLEKLAVRSKTNGWNDILTIDINHGAAPALPAENKDMLTECGQISAEQIRTASAACLNLAQRNTQNDCQLLACLQSTPDEPSKTIMATEEKAECTVGDEECGAAHLKALLSKAQVDTRAAVSAIRDQMGNLDACMAAVDGQNIKTFNNHVKSLEKKLATSGHTGSDLLNNVFKACLTCADSEFIESIKKHKSDCEDGSDLDAHALMLKAENKCKILIESEKWMAPTKEQETIVAPQAEVKTLHDTKARNAPRSTGNSNKTTQSSTKGNKTKESGSNNNNRRQRFKILSNGCKKCLFYGKHAWRNAAPKDGQPHTKTVEGKTFKWCKNHEHWSAHLTKDCSTVKDKAESDLTASVANVGVQDASDQE